MANNKSLVNQFLNKKETNKIKQETIDQGALVYKKKCLIESKKSLVQFESIFQNIFQLICPILLQKIETEDSNLNMKEVET